jgi:hypothetical protein
MQIEISRIVIDPATQMRADGVNPATVEDYAEDMAEGAKFPAIIVFYDETEEVYWLADGFHRVEAAKRVGDTAIEADVRRGGGRREAILFAAGANANHGRRRSHEDKRKSVLALLTDAEWSQWSDREIGKRCSVDGKTVAKIRAELTADFRTETERTYTTKHGTVATMKVAASEPASNGSMVAKLLAKVADAALVEECRRRGLEVSLAD